MLFHQFLQHKKIRHGHGKIGYFQSRRIKQLQFNARINRAVNALQQHLRIQLIDDKRK